MTARSILQELVDALESDLWNDQRLNDAVIAAREYLKQPEPADAKDAARYRWLRDPQNAEESGYAASLWGDHMDAAIDAAIQAGERKP